MANFHTRTIAFHSATCRACGATFQSPNADHVSNWMTQHDPLTCVQRSIVPIPEPVWED